MEPLNGTDGDAQPNHVFQEERHEGIHLDPPQSPELFSDSDNLFEEGTIYQPGITSSNKDDFLMESDRSESGSTLFQTEETCTPTRTRRRRQATSLSSTSESSDCVPVSRKLTIQEIFQKHFGKNKKSGKSGKHKPVQRKPRKNHQAYKRRRRHRGTPFPFGYKKHLSLKAYFAYEEFVVGGFLHHMENLKFEQNLHKSLKNMDAAEDLENDSLTMRKHKYLDDEGPISPISEHDGNTNCDQESEDDAKIVENDCFILSCKIPKTKEWQKKKR